MATTDAVEAIIGKIRDRGGRATDARRATIGALLNTGQSHLSAEDIVSQVKVQHPEVAKSSIYRNLTTLEESRRGRTRPPRPRPLYLSPDRRRASAPPL